MQDCTLLIRLKRKWDETFSDRAWLTLLRIVPAEKILSYENGTTSAWAATYTPENVWQLLAFPFRFKCSPPRRFFSRSRIEHAPDRPELISDYYVIKLITYWAWSKYPDLLSEPALSTMIWSLTLIWLVVGHLLSFYNSGGLSKRAY
jgi:hypothetical protein